MEYWFQCRNSLFNSFFSFSHLESQIISTKNKRINFIVAIEVWSLTNKFNPFFNTKKGKKLVLERITIHSFYVESGLRGPSPPGFYPLRGEVYCLAPEAPQKGECRRGSKVFLTLPDACGLRPCDRTHLKNGLVPHSCVGGTYDK